MRLRFLLASLGLGLVLVFAHLYALHSFLYWRFLWLDTPMHFLGGLVIGSLLVGVMGAPRRSRLYWAGAFALFIAWEIFEYSAHIPQPQINYTLDTIHDLINDALGALLIYWIARDTLWRSN